LVSKKVEGKIDIFLLNDINIPTLIDTHTHNKY